MTKLNSTWTTRNVGHVNNKEGKNQQCQLYILMVKLFEEGDLHFKIAKVRILLLLCAVGRGVKETERMRFINNFLLRCKQTL